MENDVRVLKISGAGSATGGKFYEVRISGAGEVNGDIECKLFKTSGASNVKGNVKAESVEISGASDIRGNVEAVEVKISGAAEIRGDLSASKVKISGNADVNGNVHAEDIDLKGACQIDGDCEAENYKAYGGFEIKGLLNAGNIDIKVWGNCSVKEIGGEKIDVRIGNDSVFGLAKMINKLFSKPDGLVTDLIEGDDIYLEASKVKVVRGNNVTIGMDSEIELVEYKDKINIVGNGRVKEQRMI